MSEKEKSLGITVYNVNADNRMKKINSTIPEPLCHLNQHVLFCAPTNSGKSTIVLNLLKDHLKYKWDRVIFFSSTWQYDIYKHFIFIDKENIYETYSDEALNKIVEEQKKAMETKPLYTLLIFDDMQEEFYRGSYLENFLCKCRHWNISVWVLAQYVYAISKRSRQQFTCFLTFPALINSEDEDVLAETAPIGKKKFKEACDIVNGYIYETRNKHNFLWVNKSLVQKYWLNFTSPIF